MGVPLVRFNAAPLKRTPVLRILISLVSAPNAHRYVALPQYNGGGVWGGAKSDSNHRKSGKATDKYRLQYLRSMHKPISYGSAS